MVPLFDEEATVAPLVEKIRECLGPAHTWELILVDDGSTDSTAAIATELGRRDPRVRVLQLARNYGQASATQAGFDHARGRVIVTLDGDLQNDPADIPRLVDKLHTGFDLVLGYRQRRRDKLLTRRIPSGMANYLLRWITGVKIRDVGCSLKAYRGDLVERLRLYSDLHRFVPALAASYGARIAEIPVQHHPRRRGKSKYGLSRIPKVLADFLTIKMIRSFREQPLMMMGLAAWAAFGLGIVFAATAFLMPSATGTDAVVFVGAALLWMGLGCHLVLLGLLTDMIAREHYRTEDNEWALLEAG